MKVYYFCQKDDIYGKALLNPPVLIGQDESGKFYEENFVSYSEKLIRFKDWFGARQLNLVDFKDPRYWFTDLVRENAGTGEKFNKHKERIYKIWENEVADIWSYKFFKSNSREIPIFLNQFAYNFLSDILSEAGEFVNLSFQNQKYFLFEPTIFTNALDLDYVNLRVKSSLPVPVRFLEHEIRNKLVFVVPECPMTILFTDTFVNKFPQIDKKIKGFGIKLVWDSEDPEYFDERFKDNPVARAWQFAKEEHQNYLVGKADEIQPARENALLPPVNSSTESPTSLSDRRVIRELTQDGLALVNTTCDTNYLLTTNPRILMQGIQKTFETQQRLRLSDTQRETIAASLGYCFAEQIVRLNQWEWVSSRYLHYIVSPRRSTIINPYEYALRQLTIDGDVTALLLLNSTGEPETLPERSYVEIR